MSKPVAVVDYQVCDIQECSQDRKCIACKHCKHKVLKQEAPGEPPVQFGLCQGCGTCVSACPLKAIRLM